MNYFAKQKWQRFIIIGLMVVNVLTLIMVWMGRNHRPDHNKEHGHFVKNLMVNELELTKEQELKYNKLIKEHQSSMRQLEDRIREAKRKHLELLENTDDKAGCQQALETIGTTQMEIETVTVEHFLAFKSILTDAQKSKFESIYQDALKRMSPHGKPPHKKGHPPNH